jgi:hypothetical protein
VEGTAPSAKKLMADNNLQRDAVPGTAGTAA